VDTGSIGILPGDATLQMKEEDLATIASDDGGRWRTKDKRTPRNVGRL
jgi:hypothetical protein